MIDREGDNLTLSEMQLDALREVFNIGIGRAGFVLSELVGTKVHLNIPEIGTCQIDKLYSELKLEIDEEIVSVDQGFKGTLSGNAMLIFPKESGSSLTYELCGEDEELTDIATERENSLLEVGNIVLNGVLGSLSNILGKSLAFELPVYEEGVFKMLMTRLGNKSNNETCGLAAIFARADFNISAIQATGNVLLIFEVDSFNDLITAIDSYVAEYTV